MLADGSFTFPTVLAAGVASAVSVSTEPPVTVTCTTNPAVSASVAPSAGTDAGRRGSGYVAAYSWNSGAREVALYIRTGTRQSLLGTAYRSGALSVGTTLKLKTVCNTPAVLVNDTERIAVGNGTYTGDAPGVMASGTAQAAYNPARTGRVRSPLPKHRFQRRRDLRRNLQLRRIRPAASPNPGEAVLRRTRG